MSAMDGLHTWDWMEISEEEFRKKVKEIQDKAKKKKAYGSCVRCGRELKWSRFGYTLCRWCSGSYRKWVNKKLDEAREEGGN